MPPPRRPVLTDPDVLEALAHPVRLDLLSYLGSAGPATASQCARAVDDTPSNCSYHLRALHRHGLVEPVASQDRRTRPWRATITGFTIDPEADPATPEGRGATAVLSASVALEQRRLRDFLSHRDAVPAPWRAVSGSSRYTLRLGADELRELDARIDALVRPYVAATRAEADAPPDAEIVQMGVYAIPETGSPWRRPRS